MGTDCRVGDLYVSKNLYIPPSSSSSSCPVVSSFYLNQKSSPFLHIPPSSSLASCPAVSSFYLNQKSSLFFLWHSRLGHLSSERLKLLVKSGLLKNISISDISECNECKLAKMTSLPFNKNLSVSTSPF